MSARPAGWAFAVLAPALALAACRDGTGASGPLGVGPAQLQLAPCATHQLPLTGARNDAVLWASSNPDVASVSERAVVRARAPGQATVAVRLLADTSNQAMVTVTVLAGSPSLTVAGAAADTIDGRPAQPVTAVLRHSAECPAAGVLVRFSSPRVVLDRFSPAVPAVLLAAAGTTPASNVAEVRTDSLGRAAAALRMGPRPGVFQVYVAPRGAAALSTRWGLRYTPEPSRWCGRSRGTRPCTSAPRMGCASGRPTGTAIPAPIPCRTCPWTAR